MSTKSYSNPALLLYLVLALILSTGNAFAQDSPSADSATTSLSKTLRSAVSTTALARNYSTTTIPFSVVLAEVSSAEKSALIAPNPIAPNQAPNKAALQVGFHRPIPEHFEGDLATLLTFEPIKNGSQVAAFTVTSPGASAMRLDLALTRLPQGAEVRVFGFKYDHQIYGPYTVNDPKHLKRKKPSRRFWSPVIEGDVVGVEIILPRGADRRNIELAVPQISHLTHSALDLTWKNLSHIGNSGSCNIDAACRNDERRHTAKIIYTNTSGSWLCSGTLMNDIDGQSWIPFFLTANHCINSQTAASTINSYWDFERATCGGGNPTTVTQFTGGAELLANGSSQDFSLLQFNDQVGVVFSGWDASTVAANTSVIGIHHPMGDLKKWSSGDVTSTSGGYHQVEWSQGTTEGGSSGSGLFDGAGRLRGVLSGGNASCSNLSATDYYGSFDQFYPSVKQWLSDGALGLGSGWARYSWVDQYKWQEYKITTPSWASSIYVELYGLSNDADLYVRKGTRATISAYDCRPYSSGATNEACSLSSSGMTTWYIGVRGYSSGSTSYMIEATIF